MFNIMLLEDQAAVRDIVTEVLGMIDEPLYIGAAGSLSEARHLMGERPWHGMISDLSLPDGQSLDLIAEIREQGILIPTILVSGMLSPEKERRAQSLGIDKILSKPFRPDALLAYVDELVSGRPESTATGSTTPPSENPKFSGELLSGLFSMDRNLDFMRRLVRDVPAHGGVTEICADTLTLAIDMLHADGGFMAFLERGRNKLHMVVQHDEAQETIDMECDLPQTPFSPLLEDGEIFLHIKGQQDAKELWPGLGDNPAIAIPICLQRQPVGVICIISGQWQNASISDQDRLMIQDVLVPQLDTLLDNRAVHAALEESLKETLFALARLLEARDKFTRGHSTRVSLIATDFAKRLNLDTTAIETIRTGSLLHDIGRVAVPDVVLMKPGRLTEREFSMIKTHAEIGDTILTPLDSLAAERRIVRNHHENWDGSGYPDGLKGEEIPLFARIVSVAGAIDAMTSHQCYRGALSVAACREQLLQHSGTQFDPDIVTLAIAAIDEGKIHTQKGSIAGMEANADEKLKE